MSKNRAVAERIEPLTAAAECIRNISVIAHVDHGKSTLTDSLIGEAGLLQQAKVGTERKTDTDEQEQERGITIYSTSMSLPFTRPAVNKNPNFNPNWPESPTPASVTDEDAKAPAEAEAEAEEESFLINVIDSPGHVDFSSEVSAALRVTDGALVVVDCVEGVRIQTRTVLRQALAERIKPVVFLNKLDRIFLEKDMDLEEAYQTLRTTLENINVIISTYSPSEQSDSDSKRERKQGQAQAQAQFGDVTVWPQNGTVGFGSGLHGWGFTLEHFAKLWHNKFDMSVRKMMKKLWGENYYNPKTRKWQTTQFTKKGRKLDRGFVMLVLRPIRNFLRSLMDGDEVEYKKFERKMQLNLPRDAAEMRNKDLMKLAMKQWLPAGPCLRDLIIDKLPSPVDAQQYRVETVYDGPADDEAACAIRACSPDGPLMIYISKMVMAPDNSRFYACGRVFSGTARAGMQVRIQGPDFVQGAVSEDGKELKEVDVFHKRLGSVVTMMGADTLNMSSLSAGNLIALVGVDQYISKSCTITNLNTAHNFVSMKYSVAPVVRVAIEIKNPAQLTKMTQALRRLAKVDPLVQVTRSDHGEYIVAGAGELHLQVCLEILRRKLLRGVEFTESQPVVSYCETITSPSSQVCIGKSPNKHNRVHMTAEPLSEELSQAIERGVVNVDARSRADVRQRSATLVSDFKWSKEEARKIWGFGIGDAEANMLVDRCKGVQYMHDIKDTIVSAFQQCCDRGAFTHEPLRGCLFHLDHGKVHPESAHRGQNQIMPAVRAALYAAECASGPALLEPIYNCEISVPRNHLNGVFNVLSSRRAEVQSVEDDAMVGSVLQKVTAFVPVMESFGLAMALRGATSGEAFPTMQFSHWELLPGLLTDPDSLAHRVCRDIRLRKGLSPDLPQLSDYHTRL